MRRASHSAKTYRTSLTKMHELDNALERNAPEVVRKVGYDFRVAAKQLRFRLDHCLWSLCRMDLHPPESAALSRRERTSVQQNAYVQPR
jgi:hypothetical protein